MGEHVMEALSPKRTKKLNMTQKAFRFDVVAAATLTRPMREMVRRHLLDIRDDVFSRLAPRISVAPNKRTEVGIAVSARMGTDYARMKVEGHPWDVYNKRCGCSYFWAFGSCIHVPFAINACEQVDSEGYEVFVSRNKRKRGANRELNSIGGRH
ncbi:hypothetical protein PHMEG_00019682 [Phytophthora megakarya]|uniref:SWIM-type domain-containing protein n=1 Tax=Phytophthora megakarya TaxID=4795 RepID=A0A225VSV6_9STRA|nr:hypothetical protein PHMEG_00019682 [Phytophthora megakarya]